jgi:inorganic pyrophosphatase
VNYSYIPGVFAGDGVEQDVYILGISEPVREFDGVVIGAALRKDDVEDKLIAAPVGMSFTPEQIADAVYFQEQYFDSHIVTQPGKLP